MEDQSKKRLSIRDHCSRSFYIENNFKFNPQLDLLKFTDDKELEDNKI